MSETVTIRLWLQRETEKARLYTKVPPEKYHGDKSDELWIPKSIIEHTAKRGIEHEVKLPDWFVQKENL